MSISRVKDNSVSPNIYTGYLFSGTIGQEGEKPGQYGYFKLGMKTGTIKYNAGNFPKQTVYMPEGIIVRTWEVFKEHKVKFFIGPSYNLLFCGRMPTSFDNNFITYEVVNSIGLTGIAKYRFLLFRRQWQINYDLNLPLVNWMIRPSFTGPYPEGFLRDGDFDDNGYVDVEDVLRSGNIVTMNKFFRWNQDIKLTYYLKKNLNALTLNYNWDFYRAEAHAKTALFASQGLQFGLLIHI